MKNLCAVLLALMSIALAGSSYAQSTQEIPTPMSDEDRDRKCAYIRSEIARQQSLAAMGSMQFSGMQAVMIQSAARRNVAELEARASEFGCTAAFGNRPTPSPIDRCIRACKENTSRTPEECFDACNH